MRCKRQKYERPKSVISAWNEYLAKQKTRYTVFGFNYCFIASAGTDKSKHNSAELQDQVLVKCRQKCSLININSRGPSKMFIIIIRNFTLTVASCINVIMPGDFKVVHFNRYFALTVFILMTFH